MDQLASIEAREWSPRGAIEAVQSNGPVEIKIDREQFSNLDEELLADEIEFAVNGVRERRAVMLREFLNRRNEGRSNPTASHKRTLDEKVRKYRLAILDIEEEIESPREFIKLVAYGEGDIEVKIPSRVLQRRDLNCQNLEVDINDALRRLSRSVSASMRRHRESIFLKTTK